MVSGAYAEARLLRSMLRRYSTSSRQCAAGREFTSDVILRLAKWEASGPLIRLRGLGPLGQTMRFAA